MLKIMSQCSNLWRQIYSRSANISYYFQTTLLSRETCLMRSQASFNDY